MASTPTHLENQKRNIEGNPTDDGGEENLPSGTVKPSPALDVPLANRKNLIRQLQSTTCQKLNDVYIKAAMYLEDGLNNQPFAHRQNISHNRFLSTRVTNMIHFLAACVLVSLALVEKPAAESLALPIHVHISIELLVLLVITVEGVIQIFRFGIKFYLSPHRTKAKLICIILMVLEAIIILVRQKSHFRVTRAIRPLLLLDCAYCRGVRRVARQILQSLPAIIDILWLLLFFMVFFSFFGFYLFHKDKDNPHFSTFGNSFVSLFVLLTTCNFPDVMMPALHKNRWAALYFILYLCIELHFIMNLMLAVVYETFNEKRKTKFSNCLLHHRRACRYAFELITSRGDEKHVTLAHFIKLMKEFKPNMSKRDVYLCFKSLDTDQSGNISLDQFYNVLSITSLQWKEIDSYAHWFQCAPKVYYNFVNAVNSLVTSRYFNGVIYVIIVINAIWLLFDTYTFYIYGIFPARPTVAQTYKGRNHITLAFAFIYVTEVLLKIIGFGLKHYFCLTWHTFDLLCTLAAIVGAVFGVLRYIKDFFWLLVLRPISLLTIIVKLKMRYKIVVATFIIIYDTLIRVAIVLLMLYYFYGIIGMELFTEVHLENCCNGTDIEGYYTTSGNLHFYENNFKTLLNSYLTLFELTIVNNWHVIMESYALSYSKWSRIYFMTFFLLTMVVMTILVAFLLEAFLFHIQLRNMQRESSEEFYRYITVRQALSRKEQLYLHQITRRASWVESFSMMEVPYYPYCVDPAICRSKPLDHLESTPRKVLYFIGRRSKKMYDIYSVMYESEVQQWINDEDLIVKQNSARSSAEKKAKENRAKSLLPSEFIDLHVCSVYADTSKVFDTM